MLSIIECPCSNPLSHKKFLLREREGGLDYLSQGFFSIAQGRQLLSRALTLSQINEDDIAAIEPDLVACGLPAENPPEEPGSDRQILASTHSEDTLRRVARGMKEELAAADYEMVFTIGLETFMLSNKDVEKIRTFILDLEG